MAWIKTVWCQLFHKKHHDLIQDRGNYTFACHKCDGKAGAK